MTSGISAAHASAQVSAAESTLSLGVRQAPSTAYSKTSATREDSVQLSSSAQQYLQASSQANAAPIGPGSQPTLENVVRAVAAGDRGALSLLLVI